MKIYDGEGNPCILFENHSYMWFGQNYFLCIELSLNSDPLDKIIVNGRAVVPNRCMEQDDPHITDEFRRIIEYLETHTDVREAVSRLSEMEVTREGYPLEVITRFNLRSGPIHLNAVPYKGRTTRDILTLEWIPLVPIIH